MFITAVKLKRYLYSDAFEDISETGPFMICPSSKRIKCSILRSKESRDRLVVRSLNELRSILRTFKTHFKMDKLDFESVQ